MPKGRILYGQMAIMAYLATYANLISVHHYLYNTILQYYLGNLFTVVTLKILTGTALGLHSYRVTFLLSRLYFYLNLLLHTYHFVVYFLLFSFFSLFIFDNLMCVYIS